MAKSKFVFKKNFGQDMSDLLASADENLGVYDTIKQETIPINHIVVRDNPRHLNITVQDIKEGLNEDDHLYHEKLQEYEALKRMASSIKEQGVLHDVHVFEEGSDFILVMGQRRVLASLIAEKRTINAKIWKDKPNEQVLKAYQWVENFNREDLPLWDVIDSARGMIDTCVKNKTIAKITTRETAKILYCSKSKAAHFCNLINIKPDIEAFIKDGRITSLKVAAELNKIEDDAARQKILNDASNLKESALVQIKNELKKGPKKRNETRGVQPKRVKFGYTTNMRVAENIIKKLCELPSLDGYQSEFKASVNNYRSLSRAFSKILEKLEQHFNE